MQRLKRFFDDHRRRLARLLALGGVLTVALLVVPKIPRPVEVELQLPPGQAPLVEVRVAYLEDGGEELHSARLSFPKGAPSRVHHSAKVPAGEIEVHAKALYADGRALSSVAHVHAPAEGTVVIRLDEGVP